MTAGKSITIIGCTIIFFYAIIQILKFYGVDSSVYGTYLMFYTSLVLSVFVLPNGEPTL